MSLPTLKKLCKIYEIKNISNKKKSEIIKQIKTYHSVKRIQKWFRSLKSIDQICPITITRVIYPCFAFKPKGSHLFIYYNLIDLASYLISTGDFRDPKTREVYPDQILLSIDNELLKNNIILESPLKSVFKASKNKKYYKNKKNQEESILVLERCLDDIISNMRSLIEDSNRRSNAIQTLDQLFFMAFKSYFRRLVGYSKETAESLIKRTITSINETIKEKDEFDILANNIRDHIITFLYTIRFEELNI